MERFVLCPRGCRHWGALGAAGLLLRAQAHEDPRYLLVLRHPRSHHGGTWGLPGGALKPGESALAGALRETEEELGPLPLEPPGLPVPVLQHVDDHITWSYTTLVIDVPAIFEPSAANWETADWRWVSARQALTLPLIPPLRGAWPILTGLPEQEAAIPAQELNDDLNGGLDARTAASAGHASAGHTSIDPGSAEPKPGGLGSAEQMVETPPGSPHPA